MKESADHEKIISAFGGKRGLIDIGLPSIAFLIDFNLTKNLNQASLIALLLSALFALIRIIRKETIQHAVSGLVGVAISFLLARHTGKAQDFYLPGLWTNFGYLIAYSFTNLIGWPMIGLLFGPVLGENLAWRRDPARKRAYIRAGWVMAALFGFRLLIQYPLYRAANVNALGTARLVMGYPLFIFFMWIVWQILKRVPVTKILVADEEVKD